MTNISVNVTQHLVRVPGAPDELRLTIGLANGIWLRTSKGIPTARVSGIERWLGQNLSIWKCETKDVTPLNRLALMSSLVTNTKLYTNDRNMQLHLRPSFLVRQRIL